MSRVLTNAMDTEVLRDIRARAWRFYIFDVVSTKADSIPKTINDVVLGTAITIRTEFTNQIESVSFTERGSNTADGTLGSVSIRFEFADETGIFDPVDGTQKKFLQPGNVVQVIEGFTGVDEADWVKTFTGKIIGRAGRTNIKRDKSGTLSVSAEDRMATALKNTATSVAFIQSTSYEFMMNSIITNKMGLQIGEFDLQNVGAAVFTSQATTQFVDESPVVSVSKILFTQGFVPRFGGDGKLGVTQMTIEKGSARTYVDDDIFEDIARPENLNSTINHVEVKGLNSLMTRIFQNSGRVATAGITQGFFAGDSSIRVQFSDDETIFVNNAKLRILKSMTGTLIPFGKEEELKIVVTDTDSLVPSLQGATSGRIEVSGAFYAPLVIVLFAGRIASSFIPDGNVGFIGGSTIPIGRIVEGVIAIQTAIIMSTIGTGDYEILGEPYEYAFEELRGIAEVAFTLPIDRIMLEIVNHLLDAQALVDAAALRELKLIRKRANQVTFEMRHDLRIEADDKFVRDTSRSYIVSQIDRTISRGRPDFATVQTFETTTGINP